jgi:hypothetical protein
MFDPEKTATEIADEIIHAISGAVPNCEQLFLRKGDPADMSDQDVLALRRDLKL